jgi:hypothetical protein
VKHLPVEGLAVSERAYQQAHRYALERQQGRTAATPPGEAAPIVEHPDVRRMLLLVATGVEAMRLLLLATAASTDLGRHHPEPATRAAAEARTSLLTPLAKAWSTDEGVRMSSIALQVHGGAGYVEETGIAQRYRDSHIAPIYEGTNGIQAIDLVQRKVVRDGGAALRSLVAELSAEVALAHELAVGQHALVLVDAALVAVTKAGEWLLDADDDDRLAAATPFLELTSLAVCGALYVRLARWAVANLAPDEAAPILGRFAFYAVERVAHAPALLEAVTSGARRLEPDFLP